MLGDVAYPIQFGKDNRDEIMLINFDGFIKNTSEGLVRTMLRDEDYWIEKYPFLAVFEEFSPDELYENTMFYLPMDVLHMLSDEKLSYEELLKDYEILLPATYIPNSRITSFEFALYNMMKQPFMKEVYFYRDGTFYENEISYVENQFQQWSSKIKWINGGMMSAIKEYRPTTVCTNDYQFVRYLADTDSEEYENLMVILLNTNYNLTYDEDESSFADGLYTKKMIKLKYTEEFLRFMKQVNINLHFSLIPMYNIIIETEDMEDYEEENYDSTNIENKEESNNE